MSSMRYLVVVEESENGYGAYVPDLPGLRGCREDSHGGCGSYSGRNRVSYRRPQRFWRTDTAAEIPERSC